jgi:hypothetical protein
LPSVHSTALCPLYSPLSHITIFCIWPNVPSTVLCYLYGPLSLLRFSVPSMDLSPLYSPIIWGVLTRNRKKVNTRWRPSKTTK